jgi:hypothetical protein
MSKANSAAVLKGSIREISVDTSKLPANVGRDFDDLFYVDPKLGLRPRYPQTVTNDRTYENKFLKRTLSYFIYKSLDSNSCSDSQRLLPDIHAATATRNPLQYLILVGDMLSPAMDGDARVTWDESDGQYNTKIPTGNDVAGYGIRSLSLSDTAGIFRVVTSRYPTTSPYRALEYTFLRKPMIRR